MNQAERLKYIRNKVGLSQPKFAESIGESSSKINNIENSRNDISLEIAKKVRDKYNVNFTWLLLGEGAPFISNREEPEEDINTVRVNLKKGQRLIVNYED